MILSNELENISK